MIYTLHYHTSAEYQNQNENLDTIITLDVIANSQDELNNILEQEKQNQNWDKKEALNWFAKSNLLSLNRTLIKIKDQSGNNIII